MSLVKLVCPKCKLYWADMKYEFDSAVEASDIKVRKEINTDKKIFKKGDPIKCKCGYDYRIFDIWKSITEQLENK